MKSIFKKKHPDICKTISHTATDMMLLNILSKFLNTPYREQIFEEDLKMHVEHITVFVNLIFSPEM